LQQEAVSVSDACRVLRVSRSGYYAHRRARPSARSLQEQTLGKAACAASGASYGSRRVMHALREQGLRIGRYRVRTLMRDAGLRTSWKRKFVSTTDSRHTLPVAENVLDRQFDVAEPNRAWVSDITYIRTAQGWLYLAVVLDLFSRKVVGWSMAPTMPAGLVMSALTMALQQRRPARGLVLHSDRGSQLRFKGSLQHLMFMMRVVDLSVLLLVLSIQGFYAVCNSARLRRHRVHAPSTGSCRCLLESIDVTDRSYSHWSLVATGFEDRRNRFQDPYRFEAAHAGPSLHLDPM
jgi:hypothetical protein